MPKSTKSPSVSKIRKSTGKRLRFSVFQRDHFTCQYCGAQPPDIVLVADHIKPVALGGESTIDNLITACESCNQGKAARSLADRPIRPDADLMYLETQQEIAEFNRYRLSLAKREKAIEKVVTALQNLWLQCSGLEWHPSDHVMRSLMKRYSPEIAELVVLDVAPKVAGGYIRADGDAWVRYMYAVARNVASDEEEAE